MERQGMRKTWYLAVIMLLCMAPAIHAQSLSSSAANKPCREAVWDFGNGGKGCKVAVPEGGSSASYLLLAGAFCFGGIVFRSRRQHTA